MIIFDPAWLRLRASFDAAARSPDLTRRFAGLMPDRPRLLDLAAGTAANLRFLAPRLGRSGQHWTLVDHDPALLAAAEGELDRCNGNRPPVAIRPLDLARDLDRIDFTPFDGIAATALFDLVSADWLDRLVERLALAGRPVLFALTTDGRLRWDPPDPEDDAMQARFETHQRSDKGFGPALGPCAAARLERRLTEHGFTVAAADSDWRIGPGDRTMLHAMIEVWRMVTLAVEPMAAGRIEGWAQRRRSAADNGRLTLMVGHRDAAGWFA